MIFEETPLQGAFLITLEPYRDERGSFARFFCQREFQEHGLTPEVSQCNISHNRERGTLRGLHFQTAPHEEAKLVRCARGAIWDVIVDMRSDSATQGKWFGVELTDSNQRQLYIPKGFAHGFQTLCDDTEIFYLISDPYCPEAASGLRYDDPALAIDWPAPITQISDRDKRWPDFEH